MLTPVVLSDPEFPVSDFIGYVLECMYVCIVCRHIHACAYVCGSQRLTLTILLVTLVKIPSLGPM